MIIIFFQILAASLDSNAFVSQEAESALTLDKLLVIDRQIKVEGAKTALDSKGQGGGTQFAALQLQQIKQLQKIQTEQHSLAAQVASMRVQAKVNPTAYAQSKPLFLYSILSYPIRLFYSILFYSIYCTSSILFCSIPFYSVLFYSNLFYSIPTLLYSILALYSSADFAVCGLDALKGMFSISRSDTWLRDLW